MSPGLQVVDVRDVLADLELLVGHARQIDPELLVAPLDEPRAVEPGLGVAPPHLYGVPM